MRIPPILVLSLAAFILSVVPGRPQLRAGGTTADDTLPDVDALLRLNGPAFFTAVKAVPPDGWKMLPADDLIALAGRMAGEVAAEGEESEHETELGGAFARACAAAGDERVPTLAKIYAGMPTSLYSRSQTLAPLARRWVARELRAIAEEGRTAGFKARVSPPLPDALQSAPRALTEAWTAFHLVSEPYRRAFLNQEKKPWISVESAWDAFFQTVDDVALGRAGAGRDGPGSERVMRFKWESMCGMGIERFEQPQSRALLMALLRERRLEEAAGAALALAPAQNFFGGIEAEEGDALGRDTLTGLGLDWETVFVGALLESHVQGGFGGSEHREALAVHGSARGAALLLGVARFSDDEEERATFLRPLAALVTPGPAPEEPAPVGDGETSLSVTIFPGGGSPTVERSPDAEPLPEELQAETLGFLQSLAHAGASPYALQELARVSGRLRRPEMNPTLRGLLAHPVDSVVEAAAEALRSMGESVNPRPKAGPVRFRVLLNGEPLGEREVRWQAAMGKDRSTSDTVKTDVDGVLGMSAEMFQDRTNPITGMAFTMEPAPRDAAATAADTPWFQATLPAPETLDAVTTVEVRVTTLTLSVSGPGGPLATPTGETKVRLSRRQEEKENGARMFSLLPVEFSLPADGRISLSCLQSDAVYELEVMAVGCELWRSGEVKLPGGPMHVHATLKPGVDVTGRMILPGGDSTSLTLSQLWKDGVELTGTEYCEDHRAGSLRGLGFGRYRLVFPSSERWRDPDEIVPVERRHGGAEVEFVIGPRTPPVLDLGEVQLAPAVTAPASAR